VTLKWDNTLKYLSSLLETFAEMLIASGKIPPRAMFLSQIWGTIIGMFLDQQC
jgi:hypothetical protein